MKNTFEYEFGFNTTIYNIITTIVTIEMIKKITIMIIIMVI